MKSLSIGIASLCLMLSGCTTMGNIAQMTACGISGANGNSIGDQQLARGQVGDAIDTYANTQQSTNACMDGPSRELATWIVSLIHPEQFRPDSYYEARTAAQNAKYPIPDDTGDIDYVWFLCIHSVWDVEDSEAEALKECGPRISSLR